MVDTLDTVLQYAVLQNIELPYSKSLAVLCLEYGNVKLLDEILHTVHKAYNFGKYENALTSASILCKHIKIVDIKLLEKYLDKIYLSRIRINILSGHAQIPGRDIEVFKYCMVDVPPTIIFEALINVNYKIVELLLPTATITNTLICNATIDLDMFKLIMSAADNYDLSLVKTSAISHRNLDVVMYLKSTLGVLFTMNDFRRLNFTEMTMVDVRRFAKFIFDNCTVYTSDKLELARWSLRFSNIDAFHYFVTEHGNVNIEYELESAYGVWLSNISAVTQLFNHGYVPDSKKLVMHVLDVGYGYTAVEYLNSVGAINYSAELILKSMIVKDMQMVKILTGCS
jgi:hypothetical protein